MAFNYRKKYKLYYEIEFGNNEVGDTSSQYCPDPLWIRILNIKIFIL